MDGSRASAMLFEAAVLKLDPGLIWGLLDEPDLDFAWVGRIGI